MGSLLLSFSLEIPKDYITLALHCLALDFMVDYVVGLLSLFGFQEELPFSSQQDTHKLTHIQQDSILNQKKKKKREKDKPLRVVLSFLHIFSSSSSPLFSSQQCKMVL